MGLKIASLADSSAPGRPQRLSLCMIVKDEEEALPRCLRSVQGVVDEIVIVDTGSTDRSVEIAESFGAVIVHEPWTGDFAKHRNTSIDAATGDWILILDADEELADGAALKPLLDNPDMEGYTLREVNYIGQEAGLEAVVNAAFRVFRNRPEYRYEGALHEQIQAKVDPHGGSCTAFVGIEILHYGYLDHTTEVRRKKDRNMRIVLEEVERKPNDSFTLFNAGVEFQRVNDHATALEYFSKAFGNLQSMRQYFASLLVRNLVASLKELERYDEALEVCADALEAYPDFTDLHYLQGQLHFARREYRESIASFTKAIELGDHGGDRYMAQAGMGSFYSHFALGTLHEALGDRSEAVRSYKRAITSARGFYAPPLVRLAQLLLRNDEVEEVEPFLLGLLPATKTEEALRALGEVFLTEGYPQRARTLIERSLAIAPEAHAARVTLAHAHLAADDPDLALQVLAQIPASSEAYPLACGKRVLVGLSTGRREVVDAATADAAEIADGLYSRAWTVVADAVDGHVPAGAPAEGRQDILEVAFDLAAALLELGALEAFSSVTQLLYVVATPESSLDERLGHLLLRHDFVDPAADRLLAAVGAGEVSPETFASLAEICEHKELYDDAEVFLRAALEHDTQSISRYLGLASHLAGRGRYAEANEVLAAGRVVWPHSTILRELSQSVGALATVR